MLQHSETYERRQTENYLPVIQRVVFRMHSPLQCDTSRSYESSVPLSLQACRLKTFEVEPGRSPGTASGLALDVCALAHCQNVAQLLLEQIQARLVPHGCVADVHCTVASCRGSLIQGDSMPATAC